MSDEERENELFASKKHLFLEGKEKGVPFSSVNCQIIAS